MKECKEKEDISLKIAIWKKEEKIKREKIESKPGGGDIKGGGCCSCIGLIRVEYEHVAKLTR